MSQVNLTNRLYFDSALDSWIVEFDYAAPQGSGLPGNPFLMEVFCLANQTINQNIQNARFVRVLTKRDIDKYQEANHTPKPNSGWYQFKTNGFAQQFYTADAAISCFDTVKALIKSLVGVYPEADPEPFKVFPLNLGSNSTRGRSTASIDAYPGDIIALVCSGGTGEYGFSYDADDLAPVSGTRDKFRVKNTTNNNTIAITAGSGLAVKELTIRVLLPSSYSSIEVTETVG